MAALLTIAVPSYQRRQALSTLLASIEGAVGGVNALDRVELLVVLDGSSDGSDEMLAALAVTSPLTIRWVWQPNGGLAAARNRLGREATTPLIWLVDDDMIIDSAALGRHLEQDRTVAPILMGPCEIMSERRGELSLAPYYDERHRRLAITGLVTKPDDCSFANTSLPTPLLRDHPFDERFRGYGLEDSELALRLLRAGLVIAFDPAAAIEHRSRPTPGERLRAKREEGSNMVRFARLHPDAAELAFRRPTSSTERLLRSIARPALAGWLFALARIGQGAGRRWTTVRRGGGRILTVSELLATYAGVAEAGGVPRSASA